MATVSPASALVPKLCPTCGNRYPAEALFCPNDGTPLTKFTPNGAAGMMSGPDASPVDPYLGQEISGHIQIQQLVGIGAMGRVYRAFQRGIDRDVAVKILHRELSANPQLVARFNREARVASKLQHPNVVQVHLAGQLPDGALYIVMEYLDGLSLLSALSGIGGSMPLPRALHLGLQICEASGEAHAQGIVHRDLKPENVMLVKRGEETDFVKVLDFGIARLNWADQSMATAAGLIFGTARYISPEGAQGEQVGPEGDVYAIATLIFQMLAGRTPFEGEQAVGLLIQQIHDAPPPLRSISRAGYVPEPIAAALMKNLAKRPDERDSDARAFGRKLIDAARASGLSPEAFGSRGMLQGRGVASMQLAPIQRTRPLNLEPELAAKLGASVGRSLAPLPGAATTKWTPSAEIREKLAGDGRGAPRTPAPNATSSGANARREPAADVTLDDADIAAIPSHFPLPQLVTSPSPTPPAYGASPGASFAK
jgi:eukaryotic-like serine/threonine-protein kinase